MKNNYCLIFGVMLSSSLLAQQLTNPNPAAPITTTSAAADTNAISSKTNAPASKPEKKKTAKKSTEKKSATKKKPPGAELKSVPLVAGSAVVIASNVNVRGQAKLKSEVLT